MTAAASHVWLAEMDRIAAAARRLRPIAEVLGLRSELEGLLGDVNRLAARAANNDESKPEE